MATKKRKTKKRKSVRPPKTVYGLYTYKGQTVPYLYIELPSSVNEALVAVYELKAVKTLCTTKSLV